MKGLIVLADIFEDTEALATVDVLLRAGEEITRASLMQTKQVLTRCNMLVTADVMFDDVNLDDYDYLILPGGKASFTILNVDPRVERAIDYFISKNKLVASICAAPHLLGRKGYFKDREFTVHPGFEDKFTAGTYRRDLGVVRDDRFVSAKSMYYSVEFGLEIIAFLYGEAKANEVRRQCQGEF